MQVYILLMVYVLMMSLLRFDKTIKCAIIFIPIIIISALRAPFVGNDALNYINIFQEITKKDWVNLFDSAYLEVGFIIYCKLMGYISDSGQFFIAISSIITCYYIAKTILNYSCNVVISCFLFISQYYLFYSYSAIRQYLALSIGFYALNLFIHGERTKSIPYLLISFSFHYTSIVYILSIFLISFNVTKNNIRLFLISLVMISLSYETIFFYIINLFDRFKYYRDNDFTLSGRGWDINILLYIFHAILIWYSLKLLFQFINMNKNECLNISNMSFGNNEISKINFDCNYYEIYSYMICVILSLGLNLASVSMGSAARLSQYFFIFMILNIPLLLNKIEKRDNAIMLLTVIVICFFIYCVLMLSHNNYYVVPYKFCFN